MKALQSGGLGERRLEISSNKTPAKVKISLKYETPKWMPRKICIDNQMLLTFTTTCMYVLIRTTS
jgi:hypothetical protein